MKTLMLYTLCLLILFCISTTNHTPLPTNLIILSTLSIIVAFSLNYWLVPGGFAWRNHRDHSFSKLRGPSGWPVLGILPQMGPLFHRKLASMATSFGATRLMAFSLGTNPVIISSHPETARQILCGSSFSDRPVKESARLLMFERAIGFAPHHGKYWRNLRRIAASYLFSPKCINFLEPIRQRLANQMLAEVRNQADKKGVVVLRGILQKGSLGNILESVFGKFESVGVDEIETMVKEGFELITLFNLEDYIPLKFLDFYGVKRRCYKLAGSVKSRIGEIVKERKKARDFSSTGNLDFLSSLLSLPEQEQLSEQDLVAVLWEMTFRGVDAVTVLVEWIMARLVLHQDIQEKAQQELDTYVGNNRIIQDSDIPNLHYLKTIVKEVLRMHPPGPLLSWARLAVHDVHVDKILIPAGTTAMVNMWAIAHDPSIWTNPMVFKPERFIDDDVSVTGSDMRLAPFGSGRRVCPGKALGLATVHLWLARFLQHYKWIPAEPVDLSECLKLSLEMEKPLTCRVVPRWNGPTS